MNKVGDLKNVSGVYMIRNTENGKKYIGSSKNVKGRLEGHKRRLKNSCNQNKHLQSSWNKYGSKCFEFRLISKCRDYLEVEQLLLNAYSDFNEWDRLYNFNKNANSPPIMEGENNPMYGRTGKDHPSYGREQSDEEIQNRVEKIKGQSYNPWKGGPLPEEHRKQISESLKGHEVSKETKRKISESRKGEEVSEEIRKEMSKSTRGSNNPGTELTESQVREIKKRYKNEDISYPELAKDYPVGRQGIGFIIRGVTWTHVKVDCNRNED